MMSTTEDVFKLSENVSMQTLGEDEGGVILELASGQIHTCNDTTVSFLGLVNGERTLSQIASLMMDEFDVEKSVLLADLQELASNLANEGIVV